MEPTRPPKALRVEPGEALPRLLGTRDDSGFLPAGASHPLTTAGSGAPRMPRPRRAPPGSQALPLVGRSCVLSGGPTWRA